MVILGTFIILSALLRLFMTGLDQSTAWTLWLGMLGAVLLIFVLGAAQYRANTALDTRILHEIDTARTRQAHVPEASNNRHTEQD